MNNVQIGLNTAVQLYNLLDLTNIFRHCDERAIDVHAHVLVGPRYLNVAVLPRKVREIAVERLRRYLGKKDVRPANRASAEYAIRFLNEHISIQLREDFVSFVKFTNDMDVSRGQDFRALYSELIDWFAEDGLFWTDETTHANRTDFGAAAAR